MPKYTRTCDKRGSHRAHGSCGGRRIQDLIEDSSIGDAEAKALIAANPEPIALTGMPEEQADWEDDRCHPIGCDNGHHLPGCVYLDVDA